MKFARLQHQILILTNLSLNEAHNANLYRLLSTIKKRRGVDWEGGMAELDYFK